MKIHILAPEIREGDAVGNHCLALALDWKDSGHEVELYAHAHRVASGVEIKPYKALFELPGSEGTIFCSYSVHDPQLRQVLTLPLRKMAYFHGITPPALLLDHDPVGAYHCARGYAQLSLLAQFDHVVTNSVFNLRELQKHTPGGFPAERLSVIPPISARFPLFAQMPRALRAMPAAGQPLQLLTVGRVVPHKRIEDLIEVVALLAQAGQPAHLHVVGSCHNQGYQSLLQNAIAHHGLQSHVHLHGMVSAEALAQHYQTADLLLVASQHEGFCVPVLEAMHLGLPVVLRSGTAATEVLNAPNFEYTTNPTCAHLIQDIVSGVLHISPDSLRGQARKFLDQACLQYSAMPLFSHQ